MHLLYARRALAYRSRNPFDAAAADIAHCENTGNTRFEKFRLTPV